MKQLRIPQILIVSLGLLLSISIVSPASAATLTVNEYTDGAESGNTSGTCNLREAIQAINDGADIAGDCTATGTYGTADEIQFTGTFPQTYTLTWDAGGGTAHPLIIDNDVTITGPGSGSLTIDGNEEAQIFFLGKEYTGTGITFNLSGATLANGDATVAFGSYGYNAGEGGLIYSQDGGDITLDDVILNSGNSAGGGNLYIGTTSTATINNTQIIDGQSLFNGRGGGMYIGTGSEVTITNSIIDGNTTASQSGGGIYSDAVLLEIRNSTISNNLTDTSNSDFAQGGGIFSDTQTNSEFILVDSRIINNFAPAEGGGILTDSDSIYIDGTEISGNTADTSGGGIKIGGSNTVIINSTLSGNHAGSEGGAFNLVGTGFVYFIHSTITANTVTNQTRGAGLHFSNNGNMHLIGTILAENNTTGDNDDCFTFDSPTITSGGYNLIGVNDGCSAFFTPDGSDIVGTSASPETADLQALADNDGPDSPTTTPQTHEVTVASTNVWEAIPSATCTDTFTAANYGPGGSVVDTTAHPFGTNILAEFAGITLQDQRDYPRPGMTDCEIGAFENSTLAVYDYGDAPDSYATLTASTGAFHTVDADLFMGASVDDELDGQPTASADGDDLNGTTPDDEDGVTFSTLTESNSGTADIQILNTTGGNAYLQAWVDYNSNGTFEAGEQVATDVAANASGTISIYISPPPGSAGTTYARFRLTPTAGLGSSGDGGIGEVEDYQITINDSASTVSSGGGGAGGRSTPLQIPDPSEDPQEDPETENPEESPEETPQDPEESIQAAIEKIAEAPTRQLIRVKDDLVHTQVWPRTGVDATISSALARVYGATSPFSDLDINHLYFEPTVVLYLQGVVEGYQDGTVQLERHISRVEALKLILYTTEATIFEDKRAIFPDTEEGAWYQPYLNTALYFDLISGYENGNFGPNDDVTFGQAFKMVSQILKISVSEQEQTEQHWAEKYAHELRKRNIIPPELNSNELYDQPITRGQLFALIYRAIMFVDHDHEAFLDTIELTIPKLNINNIPVQRTVLSTTAIWLRDIIDSTGFYENPLPEKNGQLVIFGHSSKYIWDPNTFGTIFRPFINDLNVGDRVELTIARTVHTYEITNKEKVPEENIDNLKNNTSDLVLFTCDLNITQRWVFSAKEITQ
ncbi:MAG: S-layer homology domain-containing protein [Candidatus Gracilibacteria bacterium]